MSALNFPGNPTIGQQYTANGLSYTWNGSIWSSVAAVVYEGTEQTLTNKTLVSPNVDGAPVPTVAGAAPLFMCRAWVNFDGIGAFDPNPNTSRIRASGNVSSVARNGVGHYTVNFTHALPDTDFTTLGLGFGGDGVHRGFTMMSLTSNQDLPKTTTSVEFMLYRGSSSTGTNDCTSVNVVVFR